MTSLKKVVLDSDTRHGRAFDIVIQVLIVVSAIGFAVETLPDLSARALLILQITEAVILILFTIEYLLRLYVSEKKVAFIFSFYGLIDLLAILPFYLGLTLDLRSLRLLRLARLAVMFKLFRYNKAANRLKRAFGEVRQEVMVFGFFSLALIYLSAVAIYYFEHEAQPDVFVSVFDGIWWAVVTLTTVGYGDIVPITLGGKIFTFFVLMIGLGMIAIPSGLVASALGRVRESEK